MLATRCGASARWTKILGVIAEVAVKYCFLSAMTISLHTFSIYFCMTLEMSDVALAIRAWSIVSIGRGSEKVFLVVTEIVVETWYSGSFLNPLSWGLRAFGKEVLLVGHGHKKETKKYFQCLAFCQCASFLEAIRSVSLLWNSPRMCSFSQISGAWRSVTSALNSPKVGWVSRCPQGRVSVARHVENEVKCPYLTHLR